MKWIKIFTGVHEARQKLKEGKPQLIVIGETRICLVLYKEKFFAVQDACSHNGESLSKGHVNYLGEIVCPWHNYRFALSSGKPCDSHSADLRTFDIRCDENGLFIAV